MNNNIGLSVAVVGANGYAGRELAGLLLQHPNTDLNSVFSRSPDWELAHELLDPAAQFVKNDSLENLPSKAHEFDTIFLATPPAVSMQLVPTLLPTGINVIDLSGAFRLPSADFSAWYAMSHTAAALLPEAQYGLCPWWKPTQNNQIKLIANPGCFATCALMALLPLLQNKIIQSDSIIIDAKSGVSGAGRTMQQDLLFCEIDNNFYPYKIGQHQHMPEIAQHINTFTQTKSEPLLITHLMPIKRGLTMSIYAKINSSLLSNTEDEIEKLVYSTFTDVYQNYPLLKHHYIHHQTPANWNKLVAIQSIIGSASTHIAYKVENQYLLIFASIDNLLKGAASQAIENFNMLHNLPLTTGLQSRSTL